MPPIQSPSGSLPARFRRPRILVIGCGDVGQRAARLLKTCHVCALSSSPDKRVALRQLGIIPLAGNLDDPVTVRRLAGLAQRVLYLAPPQANSGPLDWRTRHLLQALRRGRAPLTVVYGSTSGVYGDWGGAWVDESSPPHPQTPRAELRVDAERQVRWYGKATGAATRVLRIPGIYAPNREGGTPQARLRRGTPALLPKDDVFTNHIHADDLARACVLALWRGLPQRVYNINDDTCLKMGDYFDLAADIYGLPRPPRLSRAQAEQALPPLTMSFMSESRRMDNKRAKQELRLWLRYPTVATGLRG